MGLKVLHLIDSGGLYGAAKMLLALVAQQLNLGLEPLILSAGDPGIDEKPLETEARRLGLPVKPWRMNPGLDLPESRKIIGWAQEHGYQLMHSHGYKFNILIGLWPLCMRLPLVTTLHGYVHAPKYSKMWVYEVLDRLILRRMQGIVVVNNSMKKSIGRAARDKGRVHLIPNGVDIDGIEGRATEEIDSNSSGFLATHSPVILGVGRLSREKAFERLIESFSLVRDRYPKAGLLIVGEGKQRDELEALIKQRSLETSVLMPGFSDNVPALMTNANALVISSKTEGLPIVLLEAMTLKLAVIATAVGAIPEVLDHGDNGWVIRKPGVEDFSQALLYCLENDHQREEKVCNARHKVKGVYSSRAMALAYSTLYQQVAT